MSLSVNNPNAIVNSILSDLEKPARFSGHSRPVYEVVKKYPLGDTFLLVNIKLFGGDKSNAPVEKVDLGVLNNAGGKNFIKQVKKGLLRELKDRILDGRKEYAYGCKYGWI